MFPEEEELVFFVVVNEPSHLFELVNLQKFVVSRPSSRPIADLHYESLSYRLSTSTRAAATRRPCSPPSARAVQIGKSMDERDACCFNLILCIMMLSKLYQILVHIIIEMLLKYNSK